ncbi:MAG: protein phosphatase CheZ [Pseudomonadota bacterium]
MEKSSPKKDLTFYREVSRITVEGLAGITSDFKKFYDDISIRVHPALQGIAASELPEASDQLNAIINATEDAATKIMDILEEMQEENQKIRTALDAALGTKRMARSKVEALSGAVAALNSNESRIINIFEELSFQDLTGQRIRKIVNLVQKIELTVQGVLGNVGQKLSAESTEQAPAPVPGSELKGPQDEGQGMDQSAIDDLLAAL